MVRWMSAGLASMGQRYSLQMALAGLLLALVALTSCLGGSTNAKGHIAVQSVTLSPASNASLELGATQQFTATVKNNLGAVVTTYPILYQIQNCPLNTCQTAPLSISPAGRVCAGSWDPSFTICGPGVVGEALVTAVAGGVSSAPTTVYVHQHIDSIQVASIGTPQYDCFSEGQTWNYQATAYSNGSDITATVGQMNWNSSANGVASTNNTVSGLQLNQVQVTASTPGVTQLTASVSGSSSSPVAYTTCLVKSIMLSLASGTGSTLSVANGGSGTIQATVVDTLNNTLGPSTNLLTWGTSDPEIATVSSSGGVTAKQSSGGANIFAACVPSTCNIGVLPSLPIYSTGGTLPNGNPGYGTIAVDVTSAKIPTYVGWAATKDCYNLINCSSVLFPITPGNNPIGSSATLPRTPNSMMFTPAGDRIYIGSDQGLMYVPIAVPPKVTLISSASSPCNVTLCGTVLAISDDGNRVVISDTISSPNHVYIYSSATTIDLLIPGATAASFSPDETKIFILSNAGSMYVYSTMDALSSVPISASATGVTFAADGSFAYVAGAQPSSVSAFSTCSLPGVASTDFGDVGTNSNPLLIVPSANTQESQIDSEHSVITQNVIAVEQPSNPQQPTDVQVLTASFTRNTLKDNQFNCKYLQDGITENLILPSFYPSVANGFTAGPSSNLGEGNFTPLYMRVVNNGAQVVVVGQYIPAVLLFDVGSGTATQFPILDNGLPLAASASPDGTQIYVATCTGNPQPDDQGNLRCLTPPNGTPPGGEVHIVNLLAGGDVQQVPYSNFSTQNSMCNNLDPIKYPCTPDVIAVRPQ